MKVELNIEKKYFFAILSAAVILAAVFGVYAYGTSNPAVFGHSAGEIEGGAGGGGYVFCDDTSTSSVCQEAKKPSSTIAQPVGCILSDTTYSSIFGTFPSAAYGATKGAHSIPTLWFSGTTYSGWNSFYLGSVYKCEKAIVVVNGGGGAGGNVINAANCNPITPNPTNYNQWTTICSVTTTKTTGTVQLSASAIIIRRTAMTYASLRIRDSAGNIMAANTVSDYADSAGAIKNYPINVNLVDTLQGSTKTYYLEVAGLYTGQTFDVSGTSTANPAGSEQGPSMSNALWLKAVE